MSDVRNYEEYRAQALASLGEDYTVEDLRNEERFRSKVLDGLGMSYETEDLVNFEKYRLKVLQGIAGGGGGSSGEFKIANITWVDLPETFEDYDPRPGVLLIKTADGFEDYNDIIGLSEILLAWEDEWICSPKAIVTTKQPENVGDIAVWLQPYPDTYDFSVVSGDAFISNRGVILYGDCTLTIA